MYVLLNFRLLKKFYQLVIFNILVILFRFVPSANLNNVFLNLIVRKEEVIKRVPLN